MAYKVLFVGNSFTGYAVSTLERFKATSPNGPDDFRYQWVGGMTLLQHSTRPETLAAIRSGAFDYVVLQDQSLQAINDPPSFRAGIAALVNEVRASGAEPILYLTWARVAAGNYANDQVTVRNAYLTEAARYGLAVIRAGDVWEYFYYNDRALFNSLYDPDGIHPSIFGTFAIASSVYKVLYPGSQTWSPTVGLEASAPAIRAVALQLNTTRAPYFNTPPPVVVVPPPVEPPPPVEEPLPPIIEEPETYGWLPGILQVIL
jgi:hypothetical protein